jgi:hypothetical protein
LGRTLKRKNLWLRTTFAHVQALCISCCGVGYTFKFGDLLDQYMLNDFAVGFFLNSFDSKVIVVELRFDDSCIFFSFIC